LIVRRAYRANSYYAPTGNIWLMDHARIFRSEDEDQLRRPLAIIYDAQLEPGRHFVYGVEKLTTIDGAQLNVPNSGAVVVPAAGSVCITLTVHSREAAGRVRLGREVVPPTAAAPPLSPTAQPPR
jgi:hypothetical protein